MKKLSSKFDKVSVWLTQSIGTNTSIFLHSLLFIGIFGLRFFGVAIDQILLILTTAVSLEAIYLAIFIQMSVNKTKESLAVVEEDLGEIQDDVEEIQEDVEEIQGDVDDIQEDVDSLEVNIKDISDSDNEEETNETDTTKLLASIESQLNSLKEDIAKIKKKVF